MNRALALPETFAPVAPPLARALPGVEPLFLDIEASSLAPESWPVEIGWAWVDAWADGGRVDSQSAIVAPRPSWCASAWSQAAVDLHGLSLERVQGGRDADTVAAMTDAFDGRFVVSDNPGWDQLWLDRLREGRPRITVHSLRTLRAGLDPEAASTFALTLLRSAAPHRAGADAARLAHAWAAATR